MKASRVVLSAVALVGAVWVFHTPVRAAFNTLANVQAAVGAYVDGALVTMGSKADSACANAGSTCSEIAVLKWIGASVANSTSAVTGALGSFVAGWSPDIGNYLSVTPWTGSGTPSVLNFLGGIYNAITAGVPNIGVGSSAIATSQFQCGTGTGSTVALAARTGAIGTGRISVKISNPGATAIEFGVTGVTTSTGQTLNGAMVTDVPTTAAIYCVAGSNETITFLETY